MAEEPCNSPRMGSGIEEEIRRIVDERLREVGVIPDEPGGPATPPSIDETISWYSTLARLERDKREEAEREYCQEMKRANDRIKELEKALAFNPNP